MPNTKLLLVLAVAVAAVIVLALLTQLLRSSPRADYPYVAADLLSASELVFLRVLELALGGEYRIFTKVRLADLIEVVTGLDPSDRQAAFNKIQSKHVDFVICDAETLSTAFVIELDDRSHQRADRQRRDAFVDAALSAAEIPIFHVPVQKSYDADELRRRFA